MKKYPVYFFLLLSGFFYLTGRPIDDKAGKKDQASVQSETAIKQGHESQPAATSATKRHFVASSHEIFTGVDKSSSGDHSLAGRQMAFEGKAGRSKARTGISKHFAATAPASKQAASYARQQAASHVAMILPPPAPVHSSIRIAARKMAMAGNEAGNALTNEGELKPSSLQESGASHNSSLAGTARPKTARRKSRKTLDWRIFGNDRRASLRMASPYSSSRWMHRQSKAERRQLEAALHQEGKAGENYNYDDESSNSGHAYSSISRSRRRWRTRRSASHIRVRRAKYARKRKRRRRLASLGRRRHYIRRRRRIARSAYRLGRHRHHRHSSGKKWYASLFKPQHRHGRFGFVTIGGITSLINN